MRNAWVVVLLVFFVLGGNSEEGGRPQLVNNRVVPLSATIGNNYKEYLLTTLEFDEDVYVNDPFLCAGQEEDCVMMDCEPCDWSGNEPTDCKNPRCCGPAQWPAFPASNHTNEWCDSSLPPYTKLEFNQPSEEFTLEKGDIKYFRFFVDNEHFCRSIHVEVATHLGDLSLSVSNFVAYPDQPTLNKIENGQQFTASSQGRIDPEAQYGQSVLTICPNVNPGYERGTHSIAVFGLHETNTATVTIYLHEDRYPIPSPDDRIKCDDLNPDEIFERPAFASDYYPWAGNLCLEEGVTTGLEVYYQDWYDVVLPIRPGCREISFSSNGFLNTNMDPTALADSHLLIACGLPGDFASGSTSSLIVRYMQGWNSFYISGCFEEVTYLHCSVLNLFQSGNSYTKFYWSSESKPIRHKVSDLSPAMLTTYFGRSTAGALERSLQYEGYLDWGFFGWSWLTQPSTDPLAFYPPTFEFAYSFAKDPLEVYKEVGTTETKSNIINIVDLTTNKDTELRSRETLLEEGFIYTLGITGATGMPVELCNDSDLNSGKCQRGSPLKDENSWTDFMSTRTFSTLNVVRDVKCDGDSYNKVNKLVQDEVQKGLEGSTFDTLTQKTYLVDIYNAGLSRTSCVMTMERALGSKEDNVTKVEERYCPYPFRSEEWWYYPCCNSRAEINYCCSPTTLFAEESLYVGGDPDSSSELTCKHSDCDESFFSDIATSLNAIGNPLTGCASGIENPGFQLRVVIEEALGDYIRPCLVQSGYGDTFSGIECHTHDDCSSYNTSCDFTLGRCRTKTPAEMKNDYFECFFANMPPMVEDFIRKEILLPTEAQYPKNSKYFKEVVREAATKYDCVGQDPFDISQGERWSADSALYCKGEGLGIRSFALMEAQEDHINELCPELLCLGQGSCRWENAKKCQSAFDRIGCLDWHHEYISPTESSCPTDETVCSMSSPLSSCEEVGDDEFQCVACLSEWESCTIVEGVTTEEECARLVACEVPGGGMRFDLTKEECERIGECSSLCDGQSCRSVDEKKGACVVEGVLGDDCGEMGGMEVEGECILEAITTTYECDQAAIKLSKTTQWYSCETLDVTECSDHANFTAPYKYLRCFVDIFRDCENEDECLATGTCSDIEVTKNVLPTETGWFSVNYGTCMTPGFFLGGAESEEPYCTVEFGETQFTYACRMQVTEYFCSYLASPYSFIKPYWTAWLTPARTEETCRQEVHGRFGCALPNDYQKTYWFWQREDCECKQGVSNYFFDWSPGSWEHGISHPLTWTTKKTIPKYTWEEALSLVTMESWVRQAVEDVFVYALKSQLVCEGNYLSSSLTTLVCDCVEGGSDCYYSGDDIETEVGVSYVCANTTSMLKGPSSFSSFSETSINDLCTEATLSIVQRSWFLFPRSPPSVSFQFSEKQTKGVVVNQNGAEVGQVLGDGSQIVFEHPEQVEHFHTCLLISEEYDLYEDTYSRRDFGVLVDDFTIHPMGVDDIEERKEELLLYWCTNVTKDNLSGDRVTIFPIATIENYEDKEGEHLSHQTESLLYTLAACYIVDFLGITLFVGVMLRKNKCSFKSLPPITYLGIILAPVCVFRVVFCFVYIDDGFSELSEYVVFEIPTFLLFTGVILVLVLFMQLSKKNTFNFKGQDKKIIIFGLSILAFVWSLFIIVTIVYSEVILEETDETVCPGRVHSDNEEMEDDIRILTIVYQSVVIVLTLFFAIAFGKQSMKLFQMTKNSATKAKVFVFRLGVITVTAFLLRCILFIILLATDLTSDIYLFVTLFLTEVLMILLISIELNKAFYTSMAGVITSAVTGLASSADFSNGSGSSAQKSTGTGVETSKTES